MKDGIKEILETRQFPGISGLSDGPGSGKGQFVFSRPDLEKETKMTLSKMEDEGKLNTPEMKQWADTTMEFAKNAPKESVNYDKQGEHPLD